MQVEEHYRTAIGALRDRQWELATKNLLAVVASQPQYRDAANVLLRLEKTRPVGYWRGAFMYAVECAEWDHAETAANKLSQLDPALRDASDAAARLQELTATGWHVPTFTPCPPPPSQPISTETPPVDDHQAWLEALADEQERAALRSPTPESIITPRTMILPGPPAQPEMQAPDSRVPPAMAQEIVESFPAEGQDATTSRALKSAEYEEVRPQMSESHGPVYDTLAPPRALKTHTFLVEEADRPDEEWPEPVPPHPLIHPDIAPHQATGDNGHAQATKPAVHAPEPVAQKQESGPQVATAEVAAVPARESLPEDRPRRLTRWWRRVRTQVIVFLLVIVIILGLILLARLIRKTDAAGSASSQPPAAAIVSADPGLTTLFIL